MSNSAPRNAKAYLALAAVSFFWGTTYLAIRYGVKTAPPFLFAGSRQVAAGLLLCSWFWIKGEKLPKKQDLKTTFNSAFLMIFMGNGALTWASQFVSSGLAALICSLTPIWMMFFTRMSEPSRPANHKATLGILLGCAGMFVIFSENLHDFSNSNYLLGLVAIMVANASWAYGSIFISRHRINYDPLYGAGMQMLLAGIMLLIVSFFFEEWKLDFITPDLIWATLYLITFGSIVAYGSYIYALRNLPSTVVSIYAYINTIVAILLGWLVLDEKLTIYLAIGAAITIAGVYLVNSAYKKAKA